MNSIDPAAKPIANINYILPNETIGHIFSYFPTLPSVQTLYSVCWHWRGQLFTKVDEWIKILEVLQSLHLVPNIKRTPKNGWDLLRDVSRWWPSQSCKIYLDVSGSMKDDTGKLSEKAKNKALEILRNCQSVFTEVHFFAFSSEVCTQEFFQNQPLDSKSFSTTIDDICSKTDGNTNLSFLTLSLSLNSALLKEKKNTFVISDLEFRPDQLDNFENKVREVPDLINHDIVFFEVRMANPNADFKQRVDTLRKELEIKFVQWIPEVEKETNKKLKDDVQQVPRTSRKRKESENRAERGRGKR